MFKTSLDLSTESERKQLDVSESVYKYVKQKTKNYNKTCTKGILVYEIYLTVENDRGENFDLIDEMESRIDNDLTSLVSHSFLKNLEKIKIISDRRERIDTSTDSAGYNLSIHVPRRFDEKILPDWGANNSVMQKVTEYKLSAYNCRNHRLNVKRDIISYIENGTTPETKIGRAIVQNDDMGIFDTNDIAELNNQIDTGVNWYSQSDLTFEQIEEKQKHDDTRLSNKQKPERVEAVQNAVSNEHVSKEDTRSRVKNIFQIKSQQTLNDYMSRVDTYEVNFADKYYQDYDLVSDYDIIYDDNIRSESDINTLGLTILTRTDDEISRDKQAYLLENVLNYVSNDINKNRYIQLNSIDGIDRYNVKLDISECITIFDMADLIDSDNRKKLIDYIKEMDDEYDLDAVNKVTSKGIYLDQVEP